MLSGEPRFLYRPVLTHKLSCDYMNPAPLPGTMGEPFFRGLDEAEGDAVHFEPDPSIALDFLPHFMVLEPVSFQGIIKGTVTDYRSQLERMPQ